MKHTTYFEKQIMIFVTLFAIHSKNVFSIENNITNNANIKAIVVAEVEEYQKEQEKIQKQKNNTTQLKEEERQQKAQKNIDIILKQDQEEKINKNKQSGWGVKIAPVIGYKNKNQATLGLNFNIYYNFDKNTSIFFGLDGRWHNLITKGTYDYSAQNEDEMSNFAFRSKWDVFAKLGFQYRFDNDIFIAYYTIFGAGNSNYKVVNTNYNFNEIKVKWGSGGELGYKRIFIRGDFDLYVQSYRLFQYKGLCFEGTIGVGFYLL